MSLNEGRASPSSTRLYPLGFPGLHQKGKKSRVRALAPCHSPMLVHGTRMPAGARWLPVTRKFCLWTSSETEAWGQSPESLTQTHFLQKVGVANKPVPEDKCEEGRIKKEKATIPDEIISTDFHCCSHLCFNT